MNFEPSDDQAAFAETLSRFVTGRYDPLLREAYLAAHGGHDRAVWQELAGLGLVALSIPEEAGGLGGGAMDILAAMQALGPGLVLDPWLQALVGARLIATLGSEAQKAEWLDAIASGGKVLGLAFGEAGLDHPLAHISTSAKGGWLTGRKIGALGQQVDGWLVLADEDEEPALHLVKPDAAGLSARGYRLADGSGASDLVLDNCESEPLGSGREAIEGALALANIALCAEAVGIMDQAFRQTIEYLQLRKQFGVPLSTFQVIQHRMADCAAQFELAKSLTMRAALVADDEGAGHAAKSRAAFTAKAFVSRAARAVAEEMVQFHGAIGITEELWIGRAMKRLLVIGGLFGDARAHTAYAERFGGPGDTDIGFAEADRAFRDEVRAFLDIRLPERLRTRAKRTPGAFPIKEDWLEWQAILNAQGWLAYNWPESIGGPGWSATQRYIFERECALASAPALAAQGLRMLAPVLAKFGTAAQKDHFLPRILSGEYLWCQGYSEPEAGSDLASLKTRAVRDGDHYIVNGTKIWTTFGHFADWMFCLVRTDPDAKKQAGISFLLIDMKTPGVEVKPIRLISGDHELNQVFFDNVRVPAENLVGVENDGWTIAKFLLEHERGGTAQAPGLLAALAELRAAAADLPGRGGKVLAEDADFMHRLSLVEAEAEAMEMLELRLLSQMAAGSAPGPQTAIVGLLMANITQAIDALALEAYGPAALELERDVRPLATDGQLAMPAYLNNRAWSIMAGSNEVMRTIIAKTVLGI
jgi:alkylation response protein AidB-like acyl-CoA dehydrogenase